MRPSLTFWVLLAFLGIFIYAIIPREGGHDHARARAAQADIRDFIKPALDRFEMDNSAFPKSLQDLVKQPADAKNWRGPYFSPPNLPIDPWVNPYIYEYPGKYNPNAYDLSSAGQDGRLGTADDINNWTN